MSLLSACCQVDVRLSAHHPCIWLHASDFALLHCCRNGKFICELANLPLAEDIPIAFNSCRKGPRSLGWRSDKPAVVVWTEAQVPFWSAGSLSASLSAPFPLPSLRLLVALRQCFSVHLLLAATLAQCEDALGNKM